MTTCLGIFDPDDLEEIAKSDSELAYLARESLVTLHNVLDVHGNNEDEEPAPGHAHRTVYHGRNKVDYDCSAENLLLCDKTPLIPPSTSQEANNLFTSIEHVRNFLTQVMARNSMDNLGMEIKSKVHFGSEYLNCHWVGSLSLLVFGQGAGTMTGFTSAIDVVGHEIAHGILDSFCPLVYRDQAGALNESFSDIFGLCVKQWATKQSEWIFAKGIIPDGADLQSPGLRCFVNPGKAFFGKRNDRQIAHMKDYKALSPKVDNGGVHRYSGVPNHAFYLLTQKLNVVPWDLPLTIWLRALTQLKDSSNYYATFKDFAAATLNAVPLVSNQNGLKDIVEGVWKDVGVL